MLFVFSPAQLPRVSNVLTAMAYEGSYQYTMRCTSELPIRFPEKTPDTPYLMHRKPINSSVSPFGPTRRKANRHSTQRCRRRDDGSTQRRWDATPVRIKRHAWHKRTRDLALDKLAAVPPRRRQPTKPADTIGDLRRSARGRTSAEPADQRPKEIMYRAMFIGASWHLDARRCEQTGALLPGGRVPQDAKLRRRARRPRGDYSRRALQQGRDSFDVGNALKQLDTSPEELGALGPSSGRGKFEAGTVGRARCFGLACKTGKSLDAAPRFRQLLAGARAFQTLNGRVLCSDPVAPLKQRWGTREAAVRCARRWGSFGGGPGGGRGPRFGGVTYSPSAMWMVEGSSNNRSLGPSSTSSRIKICGLDSRVRSKSSFRVIVPASDG